MGKFILMFICLLIAEAGFWLGRLTAYIPIDKIFESGVGLYPVFIGLLLAFLAVYLIWESFTGE